jgi:hypothetical protein
MNAVAVEPKSKGVTTREKNEHGRGGTEEISTGSQHAEKMSAVAVETTNIKQLYKGHRARKKTSGRCGTKKSRGSQHAEKNERSRWNQQNRSKAAAQAKKCASLAIT